MTYIILSGVGGSSNWVPMILPLVAIVAILYSIDLVTKFVKKRRSLRESRHVHNLDHPLEDMNGHNG